MNFKKNPVVVVGGGISGMAACHALAQRNIPFLLLEQSSRLGGVIETFREGPYQMEMGPFSFLPKAATLLKLAEELGVGGERIEADPQAAQNRYVLKGKKLHRLPLTQKDFLFSSLLSPWAKLRFLLEPFAKGPPPHEETIAEFVKRRAGQAVLDNMIGPFVSGVVAGDPYQLSIAAQFPIFKELESQYGSLLKAFTERRKANPSPPTLYSFKHGMETLPKAFEKKYAANIRLNTPVAEIKMDSNGFVIPAEAGIQSISCDHLILAMPAPVTAKLVEPFNAALCKELSSIHYAPLVVAHVAYSQSQIGRSLKGFGFLSGADQKHPLLGSIWDSSVFEGRAPADEALLTFFIGGAKHPGILNWQERDFLALIRKVAAPVLKINGDPKKYWIKKYERAIPQYFLGHQKKVETIEKEAAKIKGLHLTGNYFTGVSLDDTAQHAEKVVTTLQHSHAAFSKRHWQKTSPSMF